MTHDRTAHNTGHYLMGEKLRNNALYVLADYGSQTIDTQLTFSGLSKKMLLQDIADNPQRYVNRFIERYFSSASRVDSAVRRAVGLEDGIEQSLSQVASEYGVSRIDTSKINSVIHKSFWRFEKEMLRESGFLEDRSEPDYIRDNVFSARTGYALLRGGMKSLSHLQYDTTEEEVLELRSIGKTALGEINQVLVNRGGRPLPRIKKRQADNSKQLALIRMNELEKK